MADTPLRVLIVDDEDMVRINLSAFLEDEGFIIQTASSAEEALETLSSEKFDVGVIDMRLPGIDGNSFILKAHEIIPEMKFIVHTGSTNYSLPKNLVDIGIKKESVLTKPIIDMFELTDAIRRLKG